MSDNTFKFPNKESDIKRSKQKQVARLVSFVIFIFVLVFISHELTYRQQSKVLVSEAWEMSQSQDRKIANQNESRNIKWEQELLSKIGKDKKIRQTASVGRYPTEISDFSLSELAGNYRIVTQPDLSGRIFVSELEFVDGVETLPKAYRLDDIQDFLSKNSHLFGLNQSLLNLKDNGQTKKKVETKNLDGKPVQVDVLMDQKGGLLRLSIQKID